MYEKRYGKIRAWFLKHRISLWFLKFCCLILPVFTAAGYCILLLYELIYNDLFSERFLKILLVPAGTFLLVTLIRSILNFPRPYEKYSIRPLMKKDTRGRSFPSRHAASVFIIAMAFLYANLWLGLLFLVISLLTCASRFLSGVHFFRDVLAGAAISIICGIIFFFIL